MASTPVDHRHQESREPRAWGREPREWVHNALIAVGLLDGDSAGRHGLAWAVAEAAAVGARLLVCHARPPDSTHPSEEAQLRLETLEFADPALDVAGAAARPEGQPVQLTIYTGHPGVALAKAAETADLLVMGAPRQSGWREPWSTMHYVVHRARCPVVVVPQTTNEVPGPFAGQVVVGVDGSAAARAALRFGFAYAAAHRCPLGAVHVTARAHEDFWFDDTFLETHFAAEPTALALLAEEVEPWRHRHPEVAVKRAVYTGPPLRGLLRAARGARLLVVGDRGRGLAARAVLGSVSHGAVDHASCPVAVVHAADLPGGALVNQEVCDE